MDASWKTAAASLLPVAGAVVGIIIALLLLRWAIALLLRNVVKFVRLILAIDGAAAQASSGPSTPLGVGRCLASLLIACLLYPRPAVAAARIFLSLISLVAYTVPLTLYKMAGALPQACAQDNPQSCAAPVLLAWAEIWNGTPATASIGAQQSASADYSRLPAVASVNYTMSLIEDFVRSDTQSTVLFLIVFGASLLVLWTYPVALAHMRNVSWRGEHLISLYEGVGFTISFLVASYFVLIAIVAIPIFSDHTDKFDEGLKYLKDKLESASNLYLPTGVTLVDLEKLPSPEDLRAEGRRIIAESRESPAAAKNEDSSSAGAGANPSHGLHSGVQLWLDVEINAVEFQVANVRDANKALERTLEALPLTARRFASQIEVYFDSENRGHINGSLTMKHAANLVTEYTNWLNVYIVNIKRCRDEIDTQKLAAQNMRADVLRKLSVTIALVGESWSNKAMFDAFSEGATRPTKFQWCSDPAPPIEEFISSRAGADSLLGYLGVFAGWLLKTEKPDLTLIVGLVGFGLFGALGSSFIRRIKSKDPAEAGGGVLAGLVRGVAAAFVMYLAVLGGISVVTNGASTPNPYVIFLACFVAAVFSDDVWEWARRQQTERLKAEAKDDKPATNGSNAANDKAEPAKP